MASYSTYKGRRDKFDIHWPGAFEVDSATDAVLIDNAVGKRHHSLWITYLESDYFYPGNAYSVSVRSLEPMNQ